MTRALARPEIGAFIAAVVIYIFFFIVAPPFRTPESFSTVLYASSHVGIVAVAVGLLMIGGEFDLSAGVASITYGLTAALLCYQLTLNMWVGVFVSLLLALFIGFINGYPGAEDGDPRLPDHAGHVLHPAGREPGGDEAADRFGGHQNVSDIDGFRQLQGDLRVLLRHRQCRRSRSR